MNTQTSCIVRLLNRDDIEEAIKLYDKYLGDGYLDAQTLHLFISEESGLALGSFNADGKLIAAVIASHLTKETDLYGAIPVEHREDCQQFLNLTEESSAVLLKSIITDAEYRKLGIASELVEGVNGWAASKNAGRVLSIGWEDQYGCHIQGTLERQGYKQLGRVEEFWLADSLTHGYSCPTCGHPCHCNAVFFEKQIN